MGGIKNDIHNLIYLIVFRISTHENMVADCVLVEKCNRKINIKNCKYPLSILVCKQFPQLLIQKKILAP